MNKFPFRKCSWICRQKNENFFSSGINATILLVFLDLQNAMTFKKTFPLLHVLCKNLVRWFVILRMYFGLFQSIFMRSIGTWKIPIEYKVNLKNYTVVWCVIVFIALSNCRFCEYHSGLIHRHLSNQTITQVSMNQSRTIWANNQYTV